MSGDTVALAMSAHGTLNEETKVSDKYRYRQMLKVVVLVSDKKLYRGVKSCQQTGGPENNFCNQIKLVDLP